MTAPTASRATHHISRALRRSSTNQIRAYQLSRSSSLIARSIPGILAGPRSRPFTSSTRLQKPNPFDIGSQVKMAHTIKSLITPSLLREIEDFWFLNFSPESCIVNSQDDTKRWFMGGEALDKACIEKFLPTLEALRKTGVTSGTAILDAVEPTEPCDWMSLLILLDQIPRNCYRGASASVVFTEFDPMARDIAHAAIAQNIPDENPEIRWQFAYRSWFHLPLMHSENFTDHELALEGFRKAVADVEALAGHDGATDNEYQARAVKVVKGDVQKAAKIVEMNLKFEQMHYDIIKKFGRYPHRNKALGRDATAEEKAYLEDGGETFGS